jgi:hypothetical protein
MSDHRYAIGFKGGSTYVLEIECDETTMSELIQIVNPKISQIVREGSQRFLGVPVKKPCGCGEPEA